MLYKYDKNQLIYKKDTKTIKFFLLVCIKLAIVAFILGRYARIQALDEFEKEMIVVNIQAEQQKFSEEKFVALLKELNVKFPHIVMAQSMVETGHWKSNIFKENHNLFGMKQARVRINTAGGTQNGHAYYDDWIESVYDYAFYQCRYLSGLKNEEEYLAYLGRSYAEDPNYVSKIRGLVKRENLKELFE